MAPKKILVIDDEPDLVKAITIRLQLSGYMVFSAIDGQDGIKKAEIIKPDLILLDIIMPGVDGFEVCKELKSSPQTKDIPIIVFTASGQQYVEEKCLLLGANGVMMKPFEITELFELVKNILKKYKNRRQKG